MGIADLNGDGLLPPGIHDASLDEIRQRFAYNARRAALVDGLQRALENLEAAGVQTVYIDGSFATRKKQPRDIDGCWEVTAAVDDTLLDPVFLDFSDHCAAMRRKYGVHLFIAQMTEGRSGVPFSQFFQETRDGRPKGILRVTLRGTP
jgi:hypothetical protein